MLLKKYNNLLTPGRWSNKDPKDYQILALFGVAQKLSYDSKKSSKKYNTSNRESTKGDPAYTMYLTLWILEVPKLGGGNQAKDGK